MSSFGSVRRALLMVGAVTGSLVLTIGISPAVGAVRSGDAAHPRPANSSAVDDADPVTLAEQAIDDAIAAKFDADRAQERGVSVEQVRADDESGAELGSLAARLEGEFPG